MCASTVPRVGEPGCIVAQTAPPLERPAGRNLACAGHGQPEPPTLRTIPKRIANLPALRRLASLRSLSLWNTQVADLQYKILHHVPSIQFGSPAPE